MPLSVTEMARKSCTLWKSCINSAFCPELFCVITLFVTDGKCLNVLLETADCGPAASNSGCRADLEETR